MVLCRNASKSTFPSLQCVLMFFTIRRIFDVLFHSLIMSEYQDALERANRLSVAREAALAGNESAMNVVTLEDLLIYTRSLICQLHSVKKIHAFLKVRNKFFN